jgi:hypothetical protein
MDQFKFEYSSKNIPCASKTLYIKRLIEKTELFLRRMRWKALFFLYPETKTDESEKFGFNTRKTPPVINELKEFEEKMINAIQNVEFESTSTPSNFQKTLNKDIARCKKESKVIVKADKTNNHYKMDVKEYNQLLKNNVTKTYKKSHDNQVKSINKEAKDIAIKLKLEGRIEIMAEKEAFITLKDHKDNFVNKPTCRLISPAKSEIGHVSKIIQDRVIGKMLEKTGINMWKNTNSVLEWYRKIEDKCNAKFITFDIVDFYPSITEELLQKALDYASKFDVISKEERDIIMHAKRTLIFSENTPWQKKESDQLFDVTMGSYDGAETCELVVCYILSLLEAKYGKSIGLYRDDGLGIFHEKPQAIERIKKDICAIFKEQDLNITIEANKKIVNFLDITLDLTKENFKPYMKPNSIPLYVNVESNHPPNILKNIPIGINKRLSEISSDEHVFNEATPIYQEALKKSGYNHDLKYMPNENENNKKKRRRSRNIIWFNPPYDMQTKTKIGKTFLHILDSSFPKGHKLRKIFNRNTVKLSYSCMPNIKNVVENHNKKIIGEEKKKEEKIIDSNNTDYTNTDVKMCNCRQENNCPLDGKCLSKNVVYQATVKSENNSETYVGIAETTFKTRYNNHLTSFRNEVGRNMTELSKHIWNIKERKVTFQLTWKILCIAKSYTNISKKCSLCITEKYYIMCKPELATLNKRCELISKCRHSRKFLLEYN